MQNNTSRRRREVILVRTWPVVKVDVVKTRDLTTDNSLTLKYTESWLLLSGRVVAGGGGMCAVDVRGREGGEAVWRERGGQSTVHSPHSPVSDSSAQMAAVLCYPYGVSITCVCDNSGSVYNCYPTNYKNKHSNIINNSPLQVRDQAVGCRV